MTQLMLFDSPVVTSPIASRSAVAVASPAVVAPKAVQSSAVRRSERPGTTAAAAKGNEAKAGLNHMGDLARLVLMRYDLVAARRAARAARLPR
ncbi:hypothetical protein [Novipirellula caenicola]|uniref:Uncharacterized protein n=1 Tax=Novipirellula caenicola TaxID=1536901 RepID=A0ABP9VPY6_9BACT